MPTISGKVTGWTKGPPRGFTVTDERTPPTSITVVEVEAEDLNLAVTCKGDGQRVTITYTNHAGPPAYNTLDQIRSAP